MKFCFLLTVLSAFCCSCHWDNTEVKKTTEHSISPKTQTPTWQHELAQAQKDHEIYNGYEISEDTIILLRRSVGFEWSINSGKTWDWMGKKIFRLDEFTIDDKGIWWGLERWKGIHEASYCRLHRSTDSGRTWHEFALNTNIFFPYHIFSRLHKPLMVTNFEDNKIYALRGNDPLHNWSFIKQLTKVDPLAEISVQNYFVSRENDDNKLYIKREEGKADTLVHFTKAYNIYYIEKVGNIVYVAGDAENGIDSYFAIIEYGKIKKDYIIPGGDINIKQTALHHIFLSCLTGAYLYKNNKLVQIYK